MLAYFTQFLTQHLSDQFYFRQTLHLAYVYCPPIAHNHHAITNRIEFVTAVTDENHTDAISLHLTKATEEGLHLWLIERTGRLIHHNQRAVEPNSSRKGKPPPDA